MRNQIARETKIESLMTIHSSKGLEFSVVFLAGGREYSLARAIQSMKDSDIEEEKTLHVGITELKKSYLNFNEENLYRTNPSIALGL